MVQKITSFFTEAKQEFNRVNWPTAAETVRLTMLVVAMCLAVAIFLGAFDYLFAFGLTQLISR